MNFNVMKGCPPVDQARCANFWLVGLVAFAAWAGAALVRMIEWPHWLGSEYWRDGDPILPNPDSYAWLAGAEGIGRLTNWPMSDAVGTLAVWTGQSPAWVGFWLPALLAGLPAALLAVVCAVRGYPAAGLVAGVLGGSSLGYLGRTRLGYVDTDLFALVMAVALAWIVAGLMRTLVERAGEQNGRNSLLRRYIGTIVVFWLYVFLYPSGYVLALTIFLFGGLYALWAGGRAYIPALLVAVSAILLAVHFGLLGLIAALVIGWGSVSGAVKLRVSGAIGLLVGVLIAISVFDIAFIDQTLRRIGSYSGWGLGIPEVQDWALPSVDLSIQETIGVGVAALAERIASHWLLLIVGMMGAVMVLRRWPELVTFLPLLLLGLASFWLGARFSMYATPLVAIGLGLGIALMLDKMAWRPWISGAGQCALALGILLLIGWRALEPQPDPALAPGHVAALKDLRGWSSDRGRIWSWWDRGYATQYYTGLPTLADGGSASRQRIFSLGQVFGTTSTMQAAQLMKLGAQARMEPDNSSWIQAAYTTHPLNKLEHLTAEQAQRQIDDFADHEIAWPETLPDEFIVIDWQTLRQAQWISLFGAWRLVDGDQGYGLIQRLEPPVQLDEQRGLLHTPGGAVPLLTLDILDLDSQYTNRWTRDSGAHAVINNTKGQGLLLDSRLYQMVAVQMLIGDPSEFEPYFELVSDRSPTARIYRVR